MGSASERLSTHTTCRRIENMHQAHNRIEKKVNGISQECCNVLYPVSINVKWRQVNSMQRKPTDDIHRITKIPL